MRLIVNTKLLAAVVKWAYVGDDRPHINAVAFRKNEMMATDGRALVIVPVPYLGANFSLCRHHVLAAIAAQQGLPKSGIQRGGDGKIAISISTTPGRIRFDLGYDFLPEDPTRMVSLEVPARDLSFPVIDSVIPMPKPNQPPSPDGYWLNPKYLAAIHEVNEAMGCEESGAHCESWSAPDRNSVRDGMLLSNRAEARFVIMPLRDL